MSYDGDDAQASDNMDDFLAHIASRSFFFSDIQHVLVAKQ
jgi:hypothetical protein